MEIENISFLIHEEYFEFFDELGASELRTILEAMRLHAKGEENITLPRELALPFIFIKKRMNKEMSQEEIVKQIRSEAGKKGAAARWGNKTKTKKR